MKKLTKRQKEVYEAIELFITNKENSNAKTFKESDIPYYGFDKVKGHYFPWYEMKFVALKFNELLAERRVEFSHYHYGNSKTYLVTKMLIRKVIVEKTAIKNA